MAEKYTLNWHTFSDHLQLMFKDLYEEEKHSDVTLVCDDQTQFKAHKIVLRACSPVFKKIIDNNPSQHPLIYLRGIQSYDMESILQFMYLGEGKFYYERMGEFLKVAKDLEVKEISKGVEMQNEEEEVTEETVVDNEENETEEDDEPIKKSENKIRQRLPRNQISSDVKSNKCPECGKVFTTKGSMVTHYRSVHEGIKYPCNLCDYQATTQGSLQTHIKSVHEGIKYACNQCDYQAKRQDNLQRHIQSVHEGIKYPCNQCDYQATQLGNLQTHIAAKHSDNILKCDLCDYQTKWRQKYYRHKKVHTAV